MPAIAEPRKTPADRKFVTALSRGLDVLRSFGPRDRWLTNQEMAKRTGLAKPTVSRLAYTLTRLGYLRYSEQLNKYALGSAAILPAWTNCCWVSFNSTTVSSSRSFSTKSDFFNSVFFAR